MSRALVVLKSDADRYLMAEWSAKLPMGTRVEFKGPKRTNSQNDLMWALCTEVSTQIKYHGIKLPPKSWKILFVDGLKREGEIVPNLDGTGLVNLKDNSSSDLSKEEMSDLIEIIYAYGAKHGATFKDYSPEPKQASHSGKGHNSEGELTLSEKALLWRFQKDLFQQKDIDEAKLSVDRWKSSSFDESRDVVLEAAKGVFKSIQAVLKNEVDRKKAEQHFAEMFGG